MSKRAPYTISVLALVLFAASFATSGYAQVTSASLSLDKGWISSDGSPALPPQDATGTFNVNFNVPKGKGDQLNLTYSVANGEPGFLYRVGFNITRADTGPTGCLADPFGTFSSASTNYFTYKLLCFEGPAGMENVYPMKAGMLTDSSGNGSVSFAIKNIAPGDYDTIFWVGDASTDCCFVTVATGSFGIGPYTKVHITGP